MSTAYFQCTGSAVCLCSAPREKSTTPATKRCIPARWATMAEAVRKERPRTSSGWQTASPLTSTNSIAYQSSTKPVSLSSTTTPWDKLSIRLTFTSRSDPPLDYLVETCAHTLFSSVIVSCACHCIGYGIFCFAVKLLQVIVVTGFL